MRRIAELSISALLTATLFASSPSSSGEQIHRDSFYIVENLNVFIMGQCGEAFVEAAPPLPGVRGFEEGFMTFCGL
jgi:hypothetical protein